MPQLIVRNIEEDVVRELRRRAARNGRSAEAEHRELLRSALKPRSNARTLKELLRSMPDVGEDSDFDRIRDFGREVEL